MQNFSPLALKLGEEREVTDGRALVEGSAFVSAQRLHNFFK